MGETPEEVPLALRLELSAPDEMERLRAALAGDEIARAWMVQNASPSFVDGFMVDGIGIVLVRTLDGNAVGFKRLIDGQFVLGGPDIIH